MVKAGRLDKPIAFRELVLADLYRGQRLVEKIHPDPIDPQFRIATAMGDVWIAMQLPADLGERNRHLAMVSDFMAWQLSPCFIIASELQVPDCVYAMGVSHTETIACLSVIKRRTLDFGTVCDTPIA